MYHNIANKALPIGEYDIYSLSTKQQNFYKNQWWNDIIDFKMKKNYNYQIPFRKDTMTIVVDCDLETSYRLYDIRTNLLNINIFPLVDSGKEVKLYMKVMINSTDDSSFGIWFKDRTYDEYLSLRKDIMDYVFTKRKNINGEELLSFCENLGGIDKDYN